MLTTEDVLELLAIKLIGLVPEDESVMVGTNRGLPVVMDAKTRAGKAFNNIARRLCGEEIPFHELEYKDDILHKISKMIRPGGY